MKFLGATAPPLGSALHDGRHNSCQAPPLLLSMLAAAAFAPSRDLANSPSGSVPPTLRGSVAGGRRPGVHPLRTATRVLVVPLEQSNRASKLANLARPSLNASEVWILPFHSGISLNSSDV